MDACPCSPEPRTPSSLDVHRPPLAQVIPAALSELTPAEWPLGGRASSESRPHPHLQHTCFLTPPEAASLGAKNQPKQPELHCERPALCSWGSAEGACPFHCPGPAPNERAQPARTGQGPTRPEEEGGTEGLAGWQVGGCFGGILPRIFPGVDPVAPKLGPSPSPAGGVLLQRKELAKIPSPPLQPTAGQKRVWLLYNSGAQGQWTFPTPFSAPELCSMAETCS